MKNEISQRAFYVKKIYNIVKAMHKAVLKPLNIRSRQNDVFTFTISGNCTYVLEDGTVLNVKAGDVLFLTHTEKYTFSTNEPNYEYIFCDFLLEDGIDCKSRVFTPKNRDHAENLFRKLERRFNSQSKTAEVEALSIFYEIYAMLMTAANPGYVSLPLKNKIYDAKAYLDSNYKRHTLSISELAEHVGMSEVYLRRLFHSQLGISPSQYLISQRINKARELMRYPLLSLEDCALQSGFSSLQYFCRIFKKALGTTPHKYRATLF